MSIFEGTPVIYFEAQTGVIRDKPATYTNFREYRMPACCRTELLNMCADAGLTSQGFDFSAKQLKWLDEFEIK